MLTEQENIRTSKFLSLVLRHNPQLIGINLDEQGWTDVNVLISKAQSKGVKLTFDILKYVVETNNKKRFSFNADFTKIRASQGHSVEVDLNYTPQLPPEVLFHGTSVQSVPDILEKGIMKMSRHHVHLSADPETAIKVGQRRGKAVILEIASLKMANKGFTFYLSDNGVWLTDVVPSEYISLKKSY